MLLDIEKIKVSDRIRKDFGNLQELADDIEENGLINPPVITPDTYELIAGERRLRAMELLGYKQVEVRPMAVKDAEHQLNLEISENETRKDFSKAERIDYARKLERVESLKAKNRMALGGQGKENFPTLQTRDIVAEKLQIGSGKQYEKEKFIVDNQSTLSQIDFAEWDEGKLSTNKAFTRIKAEKERLENKVKQLESREPKVIDRTDYSSISKLENQLKELQSQKSILEKKVKLNQEDSDKFNKLKYDIEFLTKQKSNIGRQIDSATELAGLTITLQNVLEYDLAPIKFKRCMEVLDTSEVAVQNLEDILNSLDTWMVEIRKFLKNDNYVDVVDTQQ